MTTVMTDKWTSLPMPDLNRPAFFLPKLRALVSARKCPACQKDICPEDFKSDLERKEYSISGTCAVCQSSIFDASKSIEDAMVDELAMTDEEGIGCNNCYACVSGGSHPCQQEEKHFCAIGECEPRKEMFKGNEACDECLKSIMENSVRVGEISRDRNQWDTGYVYSCSFHGQNVVCVEDRNDKRETWQCRECGAEDEFRVWYMHDCM